MEDFLIPIALGLDAFGVALGLGFDKTCKRINKIIFCISAAIFQALFVFIGAFGGNLFNSYIVTMPKLIGGIVLLIVGAMMLYEALSKKSEDTKIKDSSKAGFYILLGICVSIDALIIGFTIYSDLYFMEMLSKTFIVGLVTFILCVAAIYSCRFLKKVEIINKYADLLAGIILIIFALKMIFY